MYLAGEFGDKPLDVNAYAASTFFAVDRYASYMKNWRQDYARGVVIADRYTTSNAIHQCSKLERGEWDTFLQWLFDLEYRKMGIPQPDLVVYLRVDPEVSQALMLSRYGGNEGQRDIHEKDLAYLRRCQSAADYCAGRLGWTVVECCTGKAMRSIESIHDEIMGLVADTGKS
jgi:dTMP kinase